MLNFGKEHPRYQNRPLTVCRIAGLAFGPAYALGRFRHEGLVGLTDILYQSDRESITRRAARNEIEVPLRLHIGIFRPAGGGVQAERSEFIDRAWTPLSVGLMDTGAGEGRLNECSG
jgi:hypothetical protein